MVTVCLANHKGGTGKTSICINMGTYFAKKKV
ncbi:MAG: ParA family protein, partial [Nitrospirae bacterium]|nr:ParA family protein [Nitrospirota bacterium]